MQFGMLIDGEFVTANAEPRIDSINPATLASTGSVPTASATDVDRAVRAAAHAQRDWAQRSVWERAAQLRTLAASIRARGTEILQLEAADTGNTIGKLGADVQIAAGYLEYFAGLGSELKGETIPATARGLHFTLREPYGVVARIVPFNHPFMFAAAHLAAPLMAGNAVVLKTPETSPLSGSLLAELCAAHLPRGLVNVLHGYGMPTGDALVRHPLVRRIGFTGSAATGLEIQRAAAETGDPGATRKSAGEADPRRAFRAQGRDPRRRPQGHDGVRKTGCRCGCGLSFSRAFPAKRLFFRESAEGFFVLKKIR